MILRDALAARSPPMQAAIRAARSFFDTRPRVMSPEVLSLVATVVSILCVIAGGMYWWMNRTPNVRRDADEMLPLFGLDRDADGQQWVGERLATGAKPVPRPPTPPRPVAAVDEPPGGAGSAAARAGAASYASAPIPRTPPRGAPSLSDREGTRPAASHGGPQVAAQSTSQSASESAQNASHAGRLTPLEVLRAIPEVPVRRSSPQPDIGKANPTVRTFTTGSAGAAEARAGQNPDISFAARPVAKEAPKDAPVIGHGVPGTMIEGERLRFSVPAEGTLQFLPGRLQIAAGLDSGREIRFVNVPGPEGATVTFGRSEGAMYRHIQLRDQTVSRSHARMQLVDGQWELRNLSRTNAVVHNGRELATGEQQLLQDGDRIEMGEVLFTFRDR